MTQTRTFSKSPTNLKLNTFPNADYIFAIVIKQVPQVRVSVVLFLDWIEKREVVGT